MDLGKNIQKSVDFYMKNFGALVGAGAVAVLLSGITFGILSGPLMGGFLILVRKVVRGEQAEFNEIFAHFDKFVPTFLVNLICYIPLAVLGVIPFVGQLVSLVAGPIASIVSAFSLIRVIEDGLEPMDAIKKSFESIKDNLVMYWLFALVMGFISGLGVIACIIGVLATAPLSQAAMALLYTDMNSETSVEGPSVSA